MRDGDQYLSVPVQEFATEKGFTQYTPIQKLAFKYSDETENDLILMAETGAGKTEAATFPICSKVDFSMPGVRVLYISPYCSLINDQTERFEEMGSFLDFRVTKWHRDAKQSLKNSLLRKPEGVLLITPESIEAMFQHHPENVKRLFSALDYVVVDEIHEFNGGMVRGVHLKSLLYRISECCENPFRFIGLSATIGGDPAEIKNFLDRPEKTTLLRDKSIRESLITVDHFEEEETSTVIQQEDHASETIEENNITDNFSEFESSNEAEQTDDDNQKEPKSVNMTEESEEVIDESGETETREEGSPKESDTADASKAEDNSSKLPEELLNNLKDMTEGTNSLIFANSKPMVEELAVALKGLILDENTFSHTAAVSKNTREEIEYMAKNDLVSPYRICCTTTMEHGIDFPTLDQICQIGSTSSVSSLIQRAGRSGRRGGPAVIHILSTDEWDMIQSIACSNLLQRNEIEEPNSKAQFWNVLLMQILSVVRQHQMTNSEEKGILTADILVDKFTKSFAFKKSTEEDIRKIIDHCIASDLIRDFEGDLIIGDAGSNLVGKMNSYTSFVIPVEYTVKCIELEHPEIGTLPTSVNLSEGSCFKLSARKWEVTGIDNKTIYVKPAPKGKKLNILSDAAPVSKEVEQEMQRICTCEESYPFISDRCVPVLSKKREEFASYKRIGALNTPCFVNGANLFCLFPFQGTRIFNTLKLILNAQEDEYALKVNKSMAGFLDQCKDIIANPPAIEEILVEQLTTGELVPTEKLEKYLPIEYQAKMEATLKYDMEGAIAFLKSISDGSNIPNIQNDEWITSDNVSTSVGTVDEQSVMVHNIFLSEGEFIEGKKEKVMATIEEACHWVEEQASRYGKKLKFLPTYDDADDSHKGKIPTIYSETPKDADSPESCRTDANYYLGLEGKNMGWLENTMKEVKCDKAALFVNVDADGRSFSGFTRRNTGTIGVAVLYGGVEEELSSGVVAHELLHLLGADDLYAPHQSEDVVNYIKANFPNEIMQTGNYFCLDDLTISPYTAWKMRWTENKEDWFENVVSDYER